MEHEREGAGWQELPSLLCPGALQAAVRRELEGRGLSASLGTQPPAGKVAQRHGMHGMTLRSKNAYFLIILSFWL